jgi:hypothetical protein
VQAPDGKHVGGVAAADDHDVLSPHESLDVIDHPVEQREMARLAVDAGHRLIEGQKVAGAVAGRRAKEQHLRPRPAGQAEEIRRERGIEELLPAAGDDPSHHGTLLLTPAESRRATR